MKYTGNLTSTYWLELINIKRNKTLSKIEKPRYFSIELSIDPVSPFNLFVKAEHVNNAIRRAKILFREHQLTSDYSKSRYADCFSVSEIYKSEQEIIETVKNRGGFYISETEIYAYK